MNIQQKRAPKHPFSSKIEDLLFKPNNKVVENSCQQSAYWNG